MSIRKGHMLQLSEGTIRSSKSLSLLDYYNSPHSRLKPKNYLLNSVTRQSTKDTSLRQKQKKAIVQKAKSIKNSSSQVNLQYGFVKQEKRLKKTLGSTNSIGSSSSKKIVQPKKEKLVSKPKVKQVKQIKSLKSPAKTSKKVKEQPLAKVKSKSKVITKQSQRLLKTQR